MNIRGVVHGVAAAYPQMIRQGGGHIVNTASMAGLTAAGQITSYVMTKHAVVGLSLALRSEVRRPRHRCVGLCPSAVETPILDKGAIGGFVDAILPAGARRQDGLRRRPSCAGHVAGHRAETRRCWSNRRRAHAQWVLARLAPAFMQRMSIKFIAAQRSHQRRPVEHSLSKADAGTARWLRYASGRNEDRLHADAEACPCGRDSHRHSVRRLLLRSYFILIVVAAVVAYLFSPLYNRLNKRLSTGCRGRSLCWPLRVRDSPGQPDRADRVIQISEMVRSVAEWVERTDMSTLGDKTLTVTNEFLARVAVRGHHRDSRE